MTDPMMDAFRRGDFRAFVTMAAGLPLEPQPVPPIDFYPTPDGWMATDALYDGAPDSPTRNRYGLGPTQEAAFTDLKEWIANA